LQSLSKTFVLWTKFNNLPKLMYKCRAGTYALGSQNLTSSSYTHTNRLNYYPYCKACRHYTRYMDIISYFLYFVSTIFYSPRCISASHSRFNTALPHFSLYLIICLYFLPLPFTITSCRMNGILICVIEIASKTENKCGEFEKNK